MTDYYLEQLRHQLAQTRDELRRAEDELAVHRQRASRETRLRLAWQSARRRAAEAEAVVKSLSLVRPEAAWDDDLFLGWTIPVFAPEQLGAAFGEGGKSWWAVRFEEDRQRDLVHQHLDGQLPVTPEPMALPSEEQMRYRVRQALGAVKLPVPADMVDLVAIARDQQARALAREWAERYPFLFEAETGTPEPEHECRVWESDGEWNVACNSCPEYRFDMGSEHDCEVWADDHAAAASWS